MTLAELEELVINDNMKAAILIGKFVDDDYRIVKVGDDGSVDTSTLPQREAFIHRPVSGDLTNNGIQWSSTITTVDADTDYNLDYSNYEPMRAGKIDGKATGGVIEFGITVGIKSSAATPNGKIRLQARNKDGTWVDILPLTTAFALAVTEVEKTYSGYFPTVANFNAVPFDLRLAVQSDSAANHAIGRVKNSSYCRAEFEPGT